MVTPMVLVRKAVHAAVGGFTETEKNGMEDWDFWLKCASHGYWGKTILENTGVRSALQKHHPLVELTQ